MAADDTAPGDPDLREFAEAWLRDQERLWTSLGARSDSGGFERARAEWKTACERWRSAVLDTAPPALRPALTASLDQSRLWVRMALEAADREAPGDYLTFLLSPERLFEAAAAAVSGDAAASAPEPDRAQLHAMAAAVELLSRIAQSSLGAIRTRLAENPPGSMEADLQIYIEELEKNYLQAAGSDEFARVAGDLVNTWVEAEARARDLAP